jgi:alanyl-tRNA synthetase
MATEKLFYADAYQTECTAQVVSCEARKGGCAVVLDRTVFYAEGGGQPGDTGYLGAVRVTDTHERGDEVVHDCDAPLEVGSTVTAKIDWARRFDLTQQHSGEHMFSGLVHAKYGYNNVGFHLGTETVTIDFDGMIDEDGLREIELLANEAIWRNEPVEIFYPTADELAALDYRSKKELTGAVRIVRFPGCDTCACCGTHVRATGEIGLIQAISCEKFHDGVRIEMVCGRRALEYARMNAAQNRRVSNLLSAKLNQTAELVERTLSEKAALAQRVTALENASFERIAKDVAGRGDTFMIREPMAPDAVRRLADAVLGTCGGRVAVFAGDDEEGYKYAIGTPEGDVRELAKEMNAALHGRGGGKPGFVQGSVQATAAEIDAFFGL